MKNTTIKIVLDKRYEKDNTYPIRIRITHGREQQYYSTGKRITTEDFELLLSRKRPKRLNDIFQLVDFARVRAQDICKQIQPFDFGKFRKQYLNEYGSDSVYAAFEQKEKELKADGKLKTASGYTSARNSLQKFRPKLKFTDVTPIFLKDYQRWFLNRGCTKDRKNTRASLGIYMRYLRHILKRAIMEGLMPADKYPFGRYGYTIIQGRNIKKALTLSEIGSLMQFTPRSEMEERSRDFWLLSYLCNGINFKDLLLLKQSNIRGEHIIFTRAKTEEKDQEPIQIYIIAPIRELLKKYSLKNVNKEALVFPVISDPANEAQSLKERENFIRVTNKYMRRIAKEVKIDKAITTYYARHSYATILKRQGVSMEQISDALGHGDMKTTKHYLDGFENEALKKTAELLIPKLG